MDKSFVKITTLVVVKCIVFKLFKIKRKDTGYNFGEVERFCIWLCKAFMIYWIDSLMMLMITNAKKHKQWIVLIYTIFSLFFIFWKTGVFSLHDVFILDEFTIGLLYIALLLDYLFIHGRHDLKHIIDSV